MSNESAFLRFRPNLLYAAQAFSKVELQLFPAITAFVEKTYPGFETLPRGTVITGHTSASLESTASYSKLYSLINIDVEFLRVATYLTPLLQAGANLSSFGNELVELADRIIFHASIRAGYFDLLASIPTLAPLNQIQENSCETYIYGLCFLLTHEIEHLRRITDPERHVALTSLLEKDHGDKLFEVLSGLQLDYTNLTKVENDIAKKNAWIKLSKVANYSSELITEILCDQLAISLTLVQMIQFDRYDGQAINTLLAVQCLSAILEVTEKLLVDEMDMDWSDSDRMKNLTLREVNLSYMLTSLVSYTGNIEHKEKAIGDIIKIVGRKNDTFIEIINMIRQRIFLFRRVKRGSGCLSIKRLLFNSGYLHQRTSMIIPNYGSK